MTYGIPIVIECLSGFASLLPGDLVLTGSPGGSASIAPGDRVEIEIDTLVNAVIGSEGI